MSRGVDWMIDEELTGLGCRFAAGNLIDQRFSSYLFMLRVLQSIHPCQLDRMLSFGPVTDLVFNQEQLRDIWLGVEPKESSWRLMERGRLHNDVLEAKEAHERCNR